MGEWMGERKGQRVPSGAQNLPGTGDRQRQSAALSAEPQG